MKNVLGKNLKIGQTIKVWWSSLNGPSNEDTITRIEPYKGPLEYLWPKGARLVYFAFNKVGMTVANDDYFEVVN